MADPEALKAASGEDGAEILTDPVYTAPPHENVDDREFEVAAPGEVAPDESDYYAQGSFDRGDVTHDAPSEAEPWVDEVDETADDTSFAAVAETETDTWDEMPTEHVPEMETREARAESVNDDPEDWDPPQDLEHSITRFNAMQRLVYRSIRSEVGAGASNFVRSCGGRLDARLGDLFSDVRLQTDGAWDPGDLRRAVVELRVDEPWDGFQRLLDEEIERLRVHIGEARASSLRERLAALDEAEPAGWVRR